jgi:hypothetical protein
MDALVQVDVVQEPAQLGRQAHRVSGVRCGTAGVDCVQRTRWEGARNPQVQSAWRKGKPDRRQSMSVERSEVKLASQEATVRNCWTTH